MQIIVRLSFIILGPVMVLVYLRNSFRNIDNLHANYDLKYVD